LSRIRPIALLPFFLLLIRFDWLLVSHILLVCILFFLSCLVASCSAFVCDILVFVFYVILLLEMKFSPAFVFVCRFSSLFSFCLRVQFFSMSRERDFPSAAVRITNAKSQFDVMACDPGCGFCAGPAELKQDLIGGYCCGGASHADLQRELHRFVNPPQAVSLLCFFAVRPFVL
jgi:hypothetical protein